MCVTSKPRQLDVALSRIQREIDLIREYRTRLVCDVVTGQLDVREAAAALPADLPLNATEPLESEDDDSEVLDDDL